MSLWAVGVYLGVAPAGRPLGLEGAGPVHTLLHLGGGLGPLPPGELVKLQGGHLHKQVDAVQQGAGQAGELLVDGQYDEFEKVYELNRAVGLPVSLEEIEITEEQWTECMNRIPDMSDVAHYPYKVTVEMLSDAMERLKERAMK